MPLPHIKLTSNPKRVSVPPTVEINGEEIPAVVGVKYEHETGQFPYFTITLIAQSYDADLSAITAVQPVKWKLDRIKEQRMKRRFVWGI